jgi:hypothetical protein
VLLTMRSRSTWSVVSLMLVSTSCPLHPRRQAWLLQVTRQSRDVPGALLRTSWSGGCPGDDAPLCAVPLGRCNALPREPGLRRAIVAQLVQPPRV